MINRYVIYYSNDLLALLVIYKHLCFNILLSRTGIIYLYFIEFLLINILQVILTQILRNTEIFLFRMKNIIIISN